MTKLSEIAPASGGPGVNDWLVGVTAGSVNVDQLYTQAQLSAGSPNTRGVSYTLALTDFNNVVEMNVAGANTLTIPTNATVAFPIGTNITVIQYGGGATTISAPGVTLRAPSGVAIGGQYHFASLYKRATDEWYVWAT